MQDKIKNYPSIIARPYINASKKDAQWKDNQRYTFENLITILASYAVSDLLNIYITLKEPAGEDESVNDENAEIIESIKNIKNLETIGLEQMSLGKWCNVLRQTTKVLQDYSKFSFIPELSKLFQPPKNDLWKDIDWLVEQRNKDAHGAVISASDLEVTLDKRQKILDRILEKCYFLQKYSISVFDTLILESNSQLISGWKFINTGAESISVASEASTPMNEVLLVDTEKIKGTREDAFIKLRPLIIYAEIPGQKSKQISLYSKQLGKGYTKMHYLGVEGPVDIVLSEFDKDNNQNLTQRWKYLNEIYSEEDILKSNLNGKIVSPNAIEVNEVNELKIELNNTDSTDLSDVKCTLIFPEHFEITVPKEDSENSKDIKFMLATDYYASINDQATALEANPNAYVLSIDKFNEGVIMECNVEFIATEQGSVRISSPVVDYQYLRKESDEQQTQDLINIDGASIEIHDPNSPDKMVPVINVNRHYLDVSGTSINNVEIGENFVYELIVTNIGMGAARDLALEVIFPENLELVEGTDELVINLNPYETRSFKYLITTKQPGQYKIHLRDLSYKDIEGKKYISSFNDDYSIIVKSNIKKQFQFELADAIYDFTINDNERGQLESRKKELKKIYKNTDSDIEKWFSTALFDASIKNIRKLISSIAKTQGFDLTEKIVQDSKNQAKLNNGQMRKSLIFSIKDVPFFAIDITDPKNIIFHSIDSKMVERIHDFTYKVLFATNVISEYVLPLSLRYEPMLWSKELDINFFKKWINLCITTVKKEHLPIFDIQSKVEDALNIKLSYAGGVFQKFFKKRNSDPNFKKLLVNTLAEQGKPGLFPEPKKPFSTDDIVLRETGISRIVLINHKGEYLLGVNGLGKDALDDDWVKKNNVIYLTNKQLGMRNSDINRRWIDNERVAWWYTYANRSTDDIFVKIENGNISQFLELIKLHRLAVSNLCLNSSLFNKQSGINTINDNLTKLLNTGFSLRPRTTNLSGGVGSKISLEVYPYNKGLGIATVHDCVGFLHTSRKKWKLYINLYKSDGYLEDGTLIIDNLSIWNGWLDYISQFNRVFYVDKDKFEATTDQLDSFFSLLYKSIEFWNGGSNKSVCPSAKCITMVSEFINAKGGKQAKDKALLLQKLTNGKMSEYDLEKKDKRIARFCDKVFQKYNTVLPIKIENGYVSIATEYEDYIREMSQEEDGLLGFIGSNKDSDSNNSEDD